jgi:tRNA (mo5U34)-methyltransferase
MFDDLASIGLAAWHKQVRDILDERLSEAAHGNFAEWQSVLCDLPAIEKLSADLKSPAITIPATDEVSENDVRALLLGLKPWRKGPFEICGVQIDSEWRSDLKWDRIKNSIAPLDGRNILDVGCGNGYYALRMRGVGAKLVIGLDPTLIYVMQFLAICHFMQVEPVHVLPLRLQELPAYSRAFDTTFSMGVLYHQRDPEQHLRQLKASLRTGGELIIETLILPGTEAVASTPEQRYARMRNVWLLPTLPMLEAWLADAGFDNVRLIDVSDTTIEEQRTTEWMPFESLADALDPADPSRTIEGWPAPRRAALICSAP